jgi:hypothetical protein
VCKGELSLQVAREDIRRSWVAAFKRYVGSSEAGTFAIEPVE